MLLPVIKVVPPVTNKDDVALFEETTVSPTVESTMLSEWRPATPNVFVEKLESLMLLDTMVVEELCEVALPSSREETLDALICEDDTEVLAEESQTLFSFMKLS